ncbi:MAG: Mur ligase family protein [Candidatus Roizmanbacteria bacterium]
MIKLITNTLFPFTDFLYILQMEEYSSKRYLYWFKNFFWRRGIQKRQFLMLTARARIVYILSVFIFVAMWLAFLSIIIPNYLLLGYCTVASPAYIAGISICTLIFSENLIAVMMLLLSFIYIPYIVLFAHLITCPFVDIFIKRKIRHAQSVVAAMEDLRIIAIAGSYGKTSVKNYLFQLLQHTYKTQMISGNINTNLGIADWVLTRIHSNTQILIVEMDTYHPGEICLSSSITPPDISILTNIGDQHLIRFASDNDHVRALAEIFTCAKPAALCVASTDTWRTIKRLHIQTDERVALCVVDNDRPYPEVDTSHLSLAQRSNLTLALRVAKHLDVPLRFATDVVQNPLQVDRRGAISKIYGYEGIDDSYNISYTTACISIERAYALAKDKQKKLLVVTAGIPELSLANHHKNQLLGELLGKVAQFTYVLASIFSDEITKGIGDEGKYMVVENLADFVSLAQVNHPTNEYILLVLPELNDLYY